MPTGTCLRASTGTSVTLLPALETLIYLTVAEAADNSDSESSFGKHTERSVVTSLPHFPHLLSHTNHGILLSIITGWVQENS